MSHPSEAVNDYLDTVEDRAAAHAFLTYAEERASAFPSLPAMIRASLANGTTETISIAFSRPMTDEELKGFLAETVDLTRQAYPDLPEKTVLVMLKESKTGAGLAVLGNTALAPVRATALQGLIHNMLEAMPEGE